MLNSDPRSAMSSEVLGKKQRRTLVAQLLLISVLLAGCSSGKTITVEGSTSSVPEVEPFADSSNDVISTEQAVALIAALEQAPLSPDAPAQRTVLTAWVVASPDVGPLTVNDKAIGPFQESEYPYSPELFLQYMFGMARAQATLQKASQQQAIESGLRSLLAAYKSITVLDDTMHHPFLDNLDRLRQQGKLLEYVQSVEK